MQHERIKKLLQHIVDSARIANDNDIEFCASVFIGAIERNCVDEFAQSCEQFTNEKVNEIIFMQHVNEMLNNKN